MLESAKSEDRSQTKHVIVFELTEASDRSIPQRHKRCTDKMPQHKMPWTKRPPDEIPRRKLTAGQNATMLK